MLLRSKAMETPIISKLLASTQDGGKCGETRMMASS